MAVRHAWLALPLLAAIASTGCRAVGSGGQDRLLRPEPLAGPPTATAQQVADTFNRNAQAIQSVQATSQISFNQRGRRLTGGSAQGLLAMERPRNFRLQLRTMNREVADIGSNDTSFWFATAEEKKIYVGDYDPSGRVPANVTLPIQPDWIVEALGLRPITPEEVASMEVKPGPGAGKLRVSYRRATAQGEPQTKVLIVDAATKQVEAHELYAANRLLARAEVRASQTVAAAGSAEPVRFPREIVLTSYAPEPLTLTAKLEDVKLNTPVDDPAEFFAEPNLPGYARQAMTSPRASYATAPTRVHETRPAPRPEAIRLDPPIPLGDESTTRAGGPAPLSADLPAGPIVPEGIVAAPLPRAPGSLSPAPSPTAGRRPSAIGYER